MASCLFDARQLTKAILILVIAACHPAVIAGGTMLEISVFPSIFPQSGLFLHIQLPPNQHDAIFNHQAPTCTL